jgi:hypothetical protein
MEVETCYPFEVYTKMEKLNFWNISPKEVGLRSLLPSLRMKENLLSKKINWQVYYLISQIIISKVSWNLTGRENRIGSREEAPEYERVSY